MVIIVEDEFSGINVLKIGVFDEDGYGILFFLLGSFDFMIFNLGMICIKLGVIFDFEI